ncbi:DoxX family protein [Mucilaginibacter sp. X5P1]|uniref:DoxX family protein n=1 Tax=Mucilaginibacter sp. X5P1 TaxID=2723088 RepID=UPI001612980D|nr:DoxX family protein [Mucilaginibacter sp. X5P1]MBB6137596.1 putative membrane protein YphA (DoxX/SURF4 family) [Mucilaginibacter sp. X5P1]
MTSKPKTSKTINVILWITQMLLAVTFIWAASMKLFKPADLPWQWIKENPNLVKATGILDLLAGIGLLLPALLRIRPQLTIYASYGTIVLMICAIIFHISRGEASQIGFNIFIALIAVFIAWGRQKKAPIISKKPD